MLRLRGGCSIPMNNLPHWRRMWTLNSVAQAADLPVPYDERRLYDMMWEEEIQHDGAYSYRYALSGGWEVPTWWEWPDKGDIWLEPLMAIDMSELYGDKYYDDPR